MSTADAQTQLEVTETEIHVLAGPPEAEPAVLNVFAQPFLDVLLNEEKITGRKTVKGTDSLRVVLYDTPCVRNAWIEVSDDKLEAVLHVEYGTGVQRHLLPCAASGDVRITVEEKVTEPAPFNFAEIQHVLDEQKITNQIDYGAVAGLLAKGASGECICAVGTPAVQTEPEHYELLVPETNELMLIGIIPVRPVVSVAEGTLIAEHHGRVEGKPGINVHGEPIPPSPVVSKLPKLGRGAQRLDSVQVVATRSGRVVETTRLLDVAETLVLESNLKATDGYILFDGDVVVRGDVEEGAKIVAGGSVFVSGTVSKATISADDGIIVSSGVFGSTLRAGLRRSSLYRLAEVLARISEELSTMVSAVTQVRESLLQRGADLPAGKIAAKLFESRFGAYRAWPDLMDTWLKRDGETAGPIWTKFGESVSSEVSYGRLTAARDVTAWQPLVSRLQEKLADLPTGTDLEVDIQVRNAQSSNLHATGSVTSTNQGYYQCELNAGQAVRATGHPGAILACSVTAAAVAAREIGSHAEAHTTVQLTTTEGSVKATTIHPGTMLSVGAWKHKVVKEMKNTAWP